MTGATDPWVFELREIVQHPSSPLTVKYGRWNVEDRGKLWQTLGSRLFDSDLDVVRQCAVQVLTERDPKFELPPDKRYAASVYGKELRHSHDLRKGLCETLALIGGQPSALTNCSKDRIESTPLLAVRDIFEEADWILWGSLGDLLPTLAEASPEEFMNAVERALHQTPCPFDELFAQEGAGVMGWNYVTGLLWALEALAWDKNCLVRACAILGYLADRDPGGNWANRPANSLTTILLPWMPQTEAPVDKRRVAVEILQKEVPSVAWRTLISLLPNQTQSSMRTRKPQWRNTIPEDWQDRVSESDYREQVASYASLVVNMAFEDAHKLEELIGHLDSLASPAFDQVLDYLSSESVSNEPEERLRGIWSALNLLAQKHKSFSTARWALPVESVTRIENIAARLVPQNPVYRHRILFDWEDLDYGPDSDDLDIQRKRLAERREKAIEDILSYGGVEAIIRLVHDVGSPYHVSESLAAVAGREIDDFILPSLLRSDQDRLRDFVRYYVSCRRYKIGWEWVDDLGRSSWSTPQTAQFLSYLPFGEETWSRVSTWLGDDEGDYWLNDSLNPVFGDANIEYGIDKLIAYGRLGAAIRCLVAIRGNHCIDTRKAVRALLQAVTPPGSIDPLDPYLIGMIIKTLQSDPAIDADDLMSIEWAYLSLLDGGQRVLPKTLESRLASDSNVFCEVIRLLYRSRKEDTSRLEGRGQNEAAVENAWSLLRGWRVPPGMQANGTFSGAEFQMWLSSVKENCQESGHLEVAYTHVGQVLIHCPADPDGLWIHRSAADALNDEGAEEMRTGYYIGVRNSRGAHRIDPTGSPERELARQFEERADQIENAGYYRFAGELRRLADSYDSEAGRIVDEYGAEP